MTHRDELVSSLIEHWKRHPASTYRTWFLWEERLKNFRSIQRGIRRVVEEIEAGTFGNAYRGSSLETVVGSIAEQRQIFRGADHAFLWKPKLRIPDIYENRDHQLAFGRFLDVCACCDSEDVLLRAVRELAALKIKGLGPAAANILYFLHPTLALPFNTAIVNGFNSLTGARAKLGKWDDYLVMRESALGLNRAHLDLLSNDLGAVAGLLFDIGRGLCAAPPRTEDPDERANWEADLARVRELAAADRKALDALATTDASHTEVQGWLRDLGHALGFSVWVAANDRARPYAQGRLDSGCLDELPGALTALPQADTIRLIDVLWLDRASGHVAAAFEVEHSTSIYSGIVRMLDLALGAPPETVGHLYLVAPDKREGEVRDQLRRPAFHHVQHLQVRYLPYGELQKNREAMARFGQGVKAVEAIARVL